jgi:DNA-binding IclR family transcriptional regulator
MLKAYRKELEHRKMPILVRTAARVADILLCFADGEAERRVADISAALHLDKGTVSRLLGTLATKGLLQVDEATHRYRLGPAIYDLGNAVRHHVSLVEAAMPSLTWLREVTGESAHLNVLVNNDRVCVAEMESLSPLRTVVDIGRPLPAYAGASGKVLLAYLPDEARQLFLTGHELKALTANTVTNRDRLIRQFDQIRADGYCVAQGERVAGLVGIAVPVRNQAGSVLASLALGIPAARYEASVLPSHVRRLETAAGQITARIARG